MNERPSDSESAAGAPVPGPPRRLLNPNARNWYQRQQERMQADLQEVRTVQTHPTAKGDGTELHWLDMLQRRLPSRYRAERAFVIDADGHRSQQIDIVIHDRQFCPLLLDTAGGIHIPAESVYAVIEVKQNLSKHHIEYAGEKIASVRQLHRTSAEFQHASGRSRTFPRPILGGIVVFESEWSPAFGSGFESALRLADPAAQIDLGCSLTDGGFEVVYEVGGPNVTSSASDSSLIYFFFRLLHRLQQIATVPAIDYEEYGKLLLARPERG